MLTVAIAYRTQWSYITIDLDYKNKERKCKQANNKQANSVKIKSPVVCTDRMTKIQLALK